MLLQLEYYSYIVRALFFKLRRLTITYIDGYVIALRRDGRGRRRSIIKISRKGYLIYTILINLVVESRSIEKTIILFLTVRLYLTRIIRIVAAQRVIKAFEISLDIQKGSISCSFFIWIRIIIGLQAFFKQYRSYLS